MVNSQHLLVDCHVVHASEGVAPEREGQRDHTEKLRRVPTRKKPAAAEAGRAKPEVAELLLADAIGALPALRLE